MMEGAEQTLVNNLFCPSAVRRSSVARKSVRTSRFLCPNSTLFHLDSVFLWGAIVGAAAAAGRDVIVTVVVAWFHCKSFQW